jgi:hypothetical protein
MSAAVRCLAVVLVGWAGLRAASLGMVPGEAIFSLGHGSAEAAVAPARIIPPLDPAVPLTVPVLWPSPERVPREMPPLWQIQRIAIPYYVPTAAPPAAVARRSPISEAQLFPSIPGIEHWPLSSFAAGLPTQSPVSRAALPAPPAAIQPKFDKIQLMAWALLRGRQGIGTSPQSLASGGTLGGSQAGARLMYRFSPELAASLRTTLAVGTSQSEVAAGIRVTPLRSLPFALTAERRQAIGRYGGGRSAFALFAEGGIYDQSLIGFDIDGYGQAGVVGIRDREFFADGAFAFTRPLFRQLSGGFGVWGGVQPGIYRIDAGPRVSYRVRPNVRVHLDWRQRLAGSASPGSGPAVTLAGDF